MEIEYLVGKFRESLLYKHPKWTGEYGVISDFFEERTERFKKVKADGILKIGVSNEIGITQLRVPESQDFSKYKIVYPTDVIYNPMRLNVRSVGIYQGKESAITSPDYIVVKAIGNSSMALLYQFLKSDRGQAEISKKTTGSVRERVYFKNLATVVYPKLDENINSSVSTANEHIDSIVKLLNLIVSPPPNSTGSSKDSDVKRTRTKK